MPSVAATDVKLPKRTSEPFTKPTAAPVPTIANRPSAITRAVLSSLKKNEEMTTLKPTSGPTDTSIPPVNMAHIWPKPMNDSAAVSSKIFSILNEETKRTLTLVA